MDLFSRLVINDTIDGEAVIINLMSGRYYSLQHTGSEIWDLIRLRVMAIGQGRWLARKFGIRK